MSEETGAEGSRAPLPNGYILFPIQLGEGHGKDLAGQGEEIRRAYGFSRIWQNGVKAGLGAGGWAQGEACSGFRNGRNSPGETRESILQKSSDLGTVSRPSPFCPQPVLNARSSAAMLSTCPPP